MRKASAALAVLFWSTAVQAQSARYYSFLEFERLVPAAQNGYVAGSIDAMLYHSTVDSLSREIGRRQADCLTRTKILSGQLVEGILAHGKSKPAMRGASVQAVVVEYLAELCPDLLGPAALPDIINNSIK